MMGGTRLKTVGQEGYYDRRNQYGRLSKGVRMFCRAGSDDFI